jgi:hypothetical protein
MYKQICCFLLMVFMGGFGTVIFAADPALRFSDLITGPDTGLGDGKGSGVIVTVWGQFLGSAQGDSKISFVDSAGQERDAAFVYYWKNADGQLPGGPANLYASHRMQEIAFSIPDSAPGEGAIKVTVKGRSSTLPFTVRTGKIFHVTNAGNDTTGNGSFAQPWQTVAIALSKIVDPGSTMYIHDVDSGSPTTVRAIFWAKPSASSTLGAQYAMVAYPGTRPSATGSIGVSNFRVSGQVVSKLDIYSSNHSTVDGLGQPSGLFHNQTMCIASDGFGRAVGNRCTDIPGGCASGQQAAIVGNAANEDNDVSLYQILGNEIYDYGCKGGAKFQHTTYMAVRSGDRNLQVEPWRYGWNYLHGNHTKNGIHQFDENTGGGTCGSPVGKVIINDNVVVDQAGAGIHVGSTCPWTADFEIYNNVLINVGLASSWDGIDPSTSDIPDTTGITLYDQGTGLLGTVNIYNNTIYKWNHDDVSGGARSCLGLTQGGDNVTVTWNDNICETVKDKAFVAPGFLGQVLLDNVTGSSNIWFYQGAAGGATNAIAPTHWDASAIEQDPQLTVTGPIIAISETSPARDGAQARVGVTHDVYGVRRLGAPDIGAVEFSAIKIPNPPSGLTIN